MAALGLTEVTEFLGGETTIEKAYCFTIDVRTKPIVIFRHKRDIDGYFLIDGIDLYKTAHIAKAIFAVLDKGLEDTIIVSYPTINDIATFLKEDSLIDIFKKLLHMEEVQFVSR